MGLSQHRGVQNRESAAQHQLGNVIQNSETRADDQSMSNLQIGYGRIDGVDYKTSQVQATLFDKDKDIKVLNGAFLPLLTPLSQVHLLWGALREGLACRIYWRGEKEPTMAIIEIIGEEETAANFVKKKVEINEITTGAYKLLSGGMTA